MTASQPTTQRLQTGGKASQPGGTIMACPETVSGPCYIHDGIHTCRGSEGRSISFLRQNARAQKARKLGLSWLLASFPHINFAHLIGQIYVFFRVLNDAFHRGKKSGLMHVVAQGGGGKRTPFCRRKAIKSGSAHTHNMKESQDNTADSVGLMRLIRFTEAAVFTFQQRKGHLFGGVLS